MRDSVHHHIIIETKPLHITYAEFEKIVLQKLDSMKADIKELKQDVTVLKNEVFNVIKPTLEIINEKVDIMININTAKILDGQTRNYKEQIKMLRDYENKNALEHSRMNYEICKLKANA